MQTPRHRLEAGQFDNLCPLEGGKAAGGCQPEAGPPAAERYRRAHSGDKAARLSKDRNATQKRWSESVRRLRLPKLHGRVALGRTTQVGCGRRAEVPEHRLGRQLMSKAFG